MSRDRISASGLRRLGLALVAAVALSASAIPAVSAAQSQDTISFYNVSPNPTPGQIYLTVESTTALTTLSVTLASASNPDALQFTLADGGLTLQSGVSTDGIYQLTTPITDAELPFGVYTIDIAATDSGGGSGTDDLTSLTWLMQPTITMSASQTTYTYNDPSITFSGTLSLVDPDGSTVDTSDLADQTLELAGGAENQPVTTGAGGAYSITVSQPQNDAAYFTEIEQSSSIAYGASPSAYITAQQDPAEVTANVSATQLNYGQTLTVSGTAQYNPGSGYVPLSGSTVELYGGPYYDETAPIGTATTNADGQYSISFTDDGPGQLYVYAGGLPGDYFLDQVLTQAVAETVNVNVALPVKITGLTASLSPFGILSLSGCLAVVGGDGIPPALPLRAQYATSKSGPWHTLRTVSGLKDTTCGYAPDYGLHFSYQVPVAVASAYYRLSYPGSSDYEPAVSGVLHEAKILTRITSFHVSSRSVRKDGYITVSGRLWKDVKGWHPFARQRVWVLFVYQGGLYYDGSRPLTNSSGRFSGRYQVPFSAPWFAEYRGSNAYFASATAEVTVKATSASSAGSIPHLAVAPFPR